MRSMYAEYGLTRRPYGYHDIVRMASSTAGVDLSEFFKQYVEGDEVIPVDEYLAKIGLEAGLKGYSGEVFIPFRV